MGNYLDDDDDNDKFFNDRNLAKTGNLGTGHVQEMHIAIT